MKRATLYILLVLGMVLCGLGGLAEPAYADPPPLELDSCAPGFQPWDYTAKVVDCVQNAIMGAVSTMLSGLSGYLQGTVYALFTLAIAVFGIRFTSGESHVLPRAAGFLIRLGLVGIFSYALGGIGGYIFGIEGDLTTWVSGGVSPWSTLDQFLGKLLGFGPNLTLMEGLVGMLGASLFSLSAPLVFGAAGIMAILKLLLFIFDIVYSYLLAILAIAFMLVISPILVPTAIFFHLERYFKKWVDILISFMLVPVLLFAFLHLFLLLFVPPITDVFEILGAPCPCSATNSCATPLDLAACPPPNLTPFEKLNEPSFDWDMIYDTSTKQTQEAISASDPNQAVLQENPSVPSNIDPTMQSATNANFGPLFNFPGIDFGSNGIQIVQKLSVALIKLWILASLMKSMIHLIPGIASSMAGVLVNLPLESMPIGQRLQEARNNLATGLGGLAGGVIGGAAARSTLGQKSRYNRGKIGGQKRGMLGEIGGMLGGIAGGMIGK